MPPPVLSKPLAAALRMPLFPRLAGAMVAAVGAFVILAWHAHWTRAIQLLPNLPLMHYNTALCFVLCGSGLFLLTTSRARAVPWLGGAAAVLAALTLLEYIGGHDFGIDQLFLKPYFDVVAYSGRMSPLAALSFILSGVSLVLASPKELRTTHLAGAGLLACVVLAIALVTLAGYAFQIESPYGWGDYLRMAVNSAVTFSLLSSGLILWSCRAAEQQNYSFLRWLPVTGAVTLMVMVGVISIVNMAQLRNATAWRKHTYEVIESAQMFQNDYIERQRNFRGYVTMGTSDLLVAYRQSVNTWNAQIDHLKELTRDNPSQAPRLKALSDAMQDIITYDNETIGVYQRSGPQAVLQLDATGRGRVITGRVLDSLRVFSTEEKELLNQRDAKEQSDYQCVQNLLIFGSALSALLLIMANSMASRELKFRQRAEAQLQETLALKNAILQSASYAVISVSTDGVVTTFNSTAERWLGYTAAEVVGRQTPLLWHEASEIENRSQAMSRELGHAIKPGFESLVGRARLGRADEMESVFVRKDGSRFPVLLSITPLKDPAGIPTGFVGVIADMTERKRAEQRLMTYLKEVNELKTAMDEHAIVSITDPQGKITYANDKFCTISQYGREELLGQDHRLINSRLHDREFFRDMWATIGSGRVWKGEIRNRAKDGAYYWVNATFVPFFDDHGHPRQYVAIQTDITNRKLAEEKLQESEERFRLIVEGVEDYAIFMLDTEGRVASWNPGAERIKGYKAEEIIGRNFSEFYPPETQAEGRPQWLLSQALERGRVSDEGWRLRKDGSRFYVSAVITAVRDGQGQYRGFAKIARDVTESWRAEERLRASEERFRNAFGYAPIGMALVSPAGRWLKVNHALCHMIGYTEAELLQTDFQRITHPDDLEKDLDLVREVLAGKIQSYQMEKRYCHKDGSPVPVMLSVSLVRDRNSAPLHFVSQVEDITERKRAAQKIADSLREKEALLREIHHRVKNNMQVISSILQLQSGYIKDPIALDVFKDCQGRIRTMALIHEKLYRSEGMAQIDFKDYLESLVGLLLRSQTGRGVVIRHEYKIQPVTLGVDTAIPLGLIANELVSNCLKHAFAGRQRGFVQVILEQADGGGYRLAVKDDGIGLPAGFDPDKTTSLGMRLVKILGGQIHGRTEFKNNGGTEINVLFGGGAHLNRS